MAEVVAEFPADPRKGSGRWFEYLDGQVWRLEKAEAFEGYKDESSLRSAVSISAKRAGLKARVSIQDDGVYVQACENGKP